MEAWLTGKRYEKLFSFWKSRMDGCEQLVLPHDRPRSANATGAGAHHTFAITPELTAKWHQFSKDVGATPFVALLAAFGITSETLESENEIKLDIILRPEHSPTELMAWAGARECRPAPDSPDPRHPANR